MEGTRKLTVAAVPMLSMFSHVHGPVIFILSSTGRTFLGPRLEKSENLEVMKQLSGKEKSFRFCCPVQ